MKRCTFLVLMMSFVLFGSTVIWPVGASQGPPDTYVADEISVILAPGASIDAVNSRYGTTVREQIPGTAYYRLGTPGGADAFALQAEMAGDSNIVSTNLNFNYQQPELRDMSQAFLDQTSPSFVDGLYPASFFAQPSIQNLNLSQAQTISKGAGITVAVIDT